MIVVERLPMTSTCRHSIGAIGSNYQKAAGININKFEIVEELAKYADHKCDQRLLNLCADKSGEAVDWYGGICEEYGHEMLNETDTGNPDHGFYKTFATCHNLQATWVGAGMDDIGTAMIFDRGGVPPKTPGGGLFANSGIMTHIGSQPFLKVNHDGERFCNESIPYDYIYHAAAKEKDSTYCMNFDANWREQTR